MQLKVEFPGILIAGHGIDRCEICISDGATVQMAIVKLVEQLGEEFRENVLQADGKVHPMVAVLINGQNVTTDEGLKTILEENDQLTILHIIAGGD
jgi:sulfur carrier protein ThiS